MNIYRKIKINEIEKSALEPFKSREEYLIHKLNLDPCLLKTVKSRFPTFFNVNILKLKTMLDFLIAAGYSPSQLCVNGHILRHSISTLKVSSLIFNETNKRVYLDFKFYNLYKRFDEYT